MYLEGDLDLLSPPAKIRNKTQRDFQTAQTSQPIQKFPHTFLMLIRTHRIEHSSDFSEAYECDRNVPGHTWL